MLVAALRVGRTSAGQRVIESLPPRNPRPTRRGDRPSIPRLGKSIVNPRESVRSTRRIAHLTPRQLPHRRSALRCRPSCWRASRAACLRLRARGLSSTFPRPGSSLTTLGPTPTARSSSSTASIPLMDGGTLSASRPTFSAGERRRLSTSSSHFADSPRRYATQMGIVLSVSMRTGAS